MFRVPLHFHSPSLLTPLCIKHKTSSPNRPISISLTFIAHPIWFISIANTIQQNETPSALASYLLYLVLVASKRRVTMATKYILTHWKMFKELNMYVKRRRPCHTSTYIYLHVRHPYSIHRYRHSKCSLCNVRILLLTFYV